MKVLVTGTPGTGKTTFSQALSQAIQSRDRSVQIVQVNDIIKSERLYDEYDEHLDTYIIDDKKVRKYMEGHFSDIKSDFCVIETHTVTTVPKKCADLVIVLTCRTDVLYDRLQGRRYGSDKVNENMECEIMRVILEEAHERFGAQRIQELASNTVEDLEDNVEAIIELLF